MLLSALVLFSFTIWKEQIWPQHILYKQVCGQRSSVVIMTGIALSNWHMKKFCTCQRNTKFVYIRYHSSIDQQGKPTFCFACIEFYVKTEWN